METPVGTVGTYAHSAPRGVRRHRAMPWLLLLLALPGAAWSMYIAVLASAPIFGVPPSGAERA